MTLDMSTTNAPRRIVAGISWGPYTYNSSASDWEAMDVVEYVSGLQTGLQQLTYFQPFGATLADEYEALGRIRLVQAYYLAINNSLSNIIEVDGVPMFAPSIFYPEANYGPKDPGGTWSGATYTAYYTLEGLYGTYQNVKNGQTFVNGFLQGMGKSFNTLANGQLGSLRNWSTLGGAKKAFLVSSNMMAGAATVAALAGTAIYIVAMVKGDQQLMDVAVLTLNSATVVTTGLIIASNVYFTMSIRTAQQLGNVQKLATLTKTGPVNALGPVTLIMQIVLIWATFLFMVLVYNLQVGSVAFDKALASAIAQTIVVLAVFAFGLFVSWLALFVVASAAAPGVGTIAVMLLFMLDAAIYLITFALYKIFGIGRPFSIMMELSTAIADALYDVQLIFPDLSPSNRLNMVPNVSLNNYTDGFTVGNGAVLSMTITNTMRYENATFDTAKGATFAYNLQDGSASSLHNSLGINQMAGSWVNVGNNQMRYTDVVTKSIDFGVELGAGRDRVLNDAYLVESFVVQYQGCWAGVHEGRCKLYDVRKSIPIHVGANQVFDILPDTIAEFAEWNWLGFGNLVTQTLTLAPIVLPNDFDNDRLVQGIDPNDTLWDSDGDGLGDYYERTKSLDPAEADSDGDGLNDADEIREGTDPKKADTDGDGLNDYIETVEGWLIAYDGGQTRVWSNPILADADNDKLSDLEEYMFGFNPYVHTDPALIDTLIQVDNFAVNETTAPVLYLPFDEQQVVTSFTDLSDNNHVVTCDGGNGKCPVTGQTGRYIHGVQLDGVNDSIAVADSDLIDFGPNDDFTVAAWIRVDTQVNTCLLYTSDAADE